MYYKCPMVKIQNCYLRLSQQSQAYMAILRILLWSQTHILAPYLLLYHQMPFHPQSHENARQLIAGPTLPSEISTILHIHPIYCHIQIPALVFQRLTYVKQHQRSQQNAMKSCTLDHWCFQNCTIDWNQSYCGPHPCYTLFQKTQWWSSSLLCFHSTQSCC